MNSSRNRLSNPHPLRIYFRIAILVVLTYTEVVGQQQHQIKDYIPFKNEEVLDSLRLQYPKRVTPKGNPHELATMLALGYYPQLSGNSIKIKYKKNVRYPITASYAFGNIIRLRKKHKYVILIKPGSFVDRINLNQQVALIGHEMAHFVYYRKRPVIGMIPWAFSYVFSKKFRRKFERDADFFAIDHGLGWQYLQMSIYLSKNEVLEYINETGLYAH